MLLPFFRQLEYESLRWNYNFNRLQNVLVQSEHHVGHLPNTSVLCAIDGWEHAYMVDYGTRKPDYVSAVVAGLNWKTINKRWEEMVVSVARK